MMKDLRALWQALYVDAEKARCVILTGEGEKAFCAGADLKERNNLDVETWKSQHAILEEAMMAMVQCPIPIIAAVNGYAFGGGLELVLASDFAYASIHATFAFPETKIGIIPGAMGTQNLPRSCGVRRAKEICFTGSPFSAVEALNWGIVNKLSEPHQLLSDVLSVALLISEKAPLATRQVKKALNASQPDLLSGYQFEIEAYNLLIPTRDRLEGVQAFNEKRKPKFTGN
jgi:enoyl-CoA hydratase/carnithine racemase